MYPSCFEMAIMACIFMFPCYCKFFGLTDYEYVSDKKID